MRWQLLPMLLGASVAWAGPDAGTTVGRVHVTAIASDDEASEQMARALEARLASTTRLLSLRPRLGVPGRFDVTVYDAATEQGYEIELNERGEEISRRPSEGQPSRAPDELAQAEALVRASALLGDGAALYEAMPPLTVDARGRRLVNVGIMASHPMAGKPLARNEIVSVHVPSGEIVRYPEGAPPTARTGTVACGPPSQACGSHGFFCTPYEVAWPASDPVWRLKVRHPYCTSSVQPDGTGLEITDVRYQDRLVLRRAEVPVLNVSYVGNTCGPYRDWLNQENCFQAPGTDVPSPGSGIRVASSPPSTLCETGTDVGSFSGVAIYDEGDALLLMTETEAGWYRYVMEWRFYLDGTIEPLFGFGATANGCTCLAHTHHTYWRFDWALDAAQAPGSRLVLDRRRPGSSVNYDTIGNEAAFIRYVSGLDWFRVLNTETGNGYIIEPGHDDGTAAGDAFAQWDVAALVATDAEINDPGFQAPISLGPWLDLQALGSADRLVTWYRAGNYHDDPGGTGEACHVVGPRLVPLAACESTLTLDRAIYACGATASVLLHDRDLAGAGQATVQVASAAEPAGSPLVLAESPAGSGRFTGTVTLSATSTVRYLDTSQCGVSDVLLEKTAAIDCAPPVVSDLDVALNANTTVISWITNEAASTVLHYGTSVPPAQQATGLAGTSHSVTLSNLPPCSLYYFWLESADIAGNASTNLSGGYYAFTRPRSATVTCTPPPPPPPAAELLASRVGSDAIHLAWDAGCGAINYHLAYGPLALLPSYAVSGGVCGLGPLGAYQWSGVPSENLWFLVIADDGNFTEGSWGLDGAGAHRKGTTPSSWCFSARTNAGVCP